MTRAYPMNLPHPSDLRYSPNRHRGRHRQGTPSATAAVLAYTLVPPACSALDADRVSVHRTYRLTSGTEKKKLSRESGLSTSSPRRLIASGPAARVSVGLRFLSGFWGVRGEWIRLASTWMDPPSLDEYISSNYSPKAFLMSMVDSLVIITSITELDTQAYKRFTHSHR